jgi:hypothetical protein
MNVVDFLICDDIRTEIGNKYSIIGLYDDAITFNVPVVEKGKWPKIIKLGIFIKARFDNDQEKKQTGKFRLDVMLNEINKTIAEGELHFGEKKEATGINMAVVFNQFVFESPGLMSVKMVLLNHKNEEIASIEYPDKIKITETVL